MKLPKGIRQRGNSLMVDATYRDERRTSTIKLEDHTTVELAVAEAVKKKSEMVYSMQTGKSTVQESKVWTIGKAYERACSAQWTTEGTDRQKLNGKMAVTFFGSETKLDKIDLNEVDEWVAELEDDGNADATINRKLSALQTMMTVAKDRGGLNVLPKMPRRKEFNGRIRFLSQPEETTALQLLGQWGKDDERDAVVVLIDTGMRSGELVRIEERDVDLKGNLIHIWKTKADQPRAVPMTKRVKAVIERRIAAVAGTGEARVFPYHKQWLRHTWDRLRSAMGLDKDLQFVVHALRHTCASRLVQRGVPLKVVQEWLGHKTIIMTMRYSHLAPANLAAAVAVLEPAENVVPLRSKAG